MTCRSLLNIFGCPDIDRLARLFANDPIEARLVRRWSVANGTPAVDRRTRSSGLLSFMGVDTQRHLDRLFRRSLLPAKEINQLPEHDARPPVAVRPQTAGKRTSRDRDYKP